MIHLNRKGFTLIEVLLTLAISSIIIGLLSSALINTFTYYHRTESHIDLRREANLLITALSNMHKTNESPTIIYEYHGTGKNNLQIGNASFSNDRFEIEIRFTNKETVYINTATTNITQTFPLDPKLDLTIEYLKLTDINNPNSSYEIETQIIVPAVNRTESITIDEEFNVN